MTLPSRALPRHRFESARPFTTFLEQVQANAALWRDTYRLVRVPPDAVDQLAAVPGRWHLLVIAEDWCGDGVNTVPLLARLAERVPNVDLRVVARDEDPALMNAHLTNGSRSIPVVIVLDEDLVEQGWWGPRPAALQEWAVGEGAALPKDERYRHVRRWYARDRGRTIVDEVVNVVACAAERSALTRLERPSPSSRPRDALSCRARRVGHTGSSTRPARS